MRILFVSNSFPSNLSSSNNRSIGGTQRRQDMFIHALKQIAELDILFYVPDGIEISPFITRQIEKELSDYWNTKVNLFLTNRLTLPIWQQQLGGIFDFSKQFSFLNTSGTQQLQAFEACLARQPDVVFIQRLQSVHPALSTKKTLPPVFFDLDDIEHIKHLRELKLPPFRIQRFLYYLHFPALWWGERRAMQLAQRTFVCSEHDRRYLSKQGISSGIVTIPNAIPIPPPQSLVSEPTLLLIGSYNYAPNVKAASFLIEQVLPRIREKQPAAKLIIAGSSPQQIPNYEDQLPGVEFTGFVDDLEALYQRSRVICCPIFAGGGTRIKMIEAAAYNKPIVSTQIGAEGLDMFPGQDFLLANTADEFVEACLKLLEDDLLCSKLGAGARAITVQNYDVDRIAKLIQIQLTDCSGEIEPTVESPSQRMTQPTSDTVSTQSTSIEL